MKKKTTITVLSSVLVLLLFVMVFGLISHFTNGFKEDFKTFYVSYAGTDIMSEKSKTVLACGEEHRFDVTYVFEGLDEDAETKSYQVEIVSNVEKGQEITYTVDGETMRYEDGMYLTKAFTIEKEDRHFIIRLPEDTSLEKVLEGVYGKEVEVPGNADYVDQYLYTLVVSSYDESVRYYIDFAFGMGVESVTLNTSEVVF